MTYNKDVQTVSVERILQEDATSYTDGDVVIIETADGLVRNSNYLFEMVMVAFCEKGKVQMDINDKRVNIGEGDFIILIPQTVVSNIMVSTDVQFRAIGISYEAVQRNVHIGKDAWDILHYITQYPIFHVNPNAFKLIHTYYELLTIKLRDKNGAYFKEIMKSLYGCFYYEISSAILPLAKEKYTNDDLSHSGLICKRFFELLARSEGKERSVTALANELCITPKYLSTVIKTSSGQTALYWIHKHTINIIERQLKYTDKTIKEIANDLNFSNISFFGKFVKTHTGMSPTELRMKRDAKTETMEDGDTSDGYTPNVHIRPSI